MTQSKQHVSLPSLLVREFNLMAVPIRNSNVCASSRRVLRTKTTSSPSPLAPRSAYPSTPNFTGMRNPSFALSLAFLEVLQLPVRSFCRDCTFGEIVAQFYLGSSRPYPRKPGVRRTLPSPSSHRLYRSSSTGTTIRRPS